MFSPIAPLRTIARSARPTTVTRSLPRSMPVMARLYSDKPAEEAKEGETKAAEGSSGDAEKVKALEEKVKSLEKDILYHRAETQTMARRVDDERRKATEFAISKFAQALLSTTDTFEIALKHVPKPVEPGTPLASLVQGVELTHKALLKTFEQNGVKKMEVEQGSSFDPNLHEATFQIPKEVAPKKSQGEWSAGEVVEVNKDGWMIGSRVLRPAQVGVTQIE